MTGPRRDGRCRPRRGGRGLRLVAYAAAACLAALVAWPAWLQLTGNFHEVVPGRLYRSAQPDAHDLARIAAETGIRSVLNLRGAQRGKPWYQAEIAESKALGLAHVDFKMSARRTLAPDEIAHLAETLSEMPQPLLIHCRAGADRTGLASALFLLTVENAPAEAAGRQISFAYGHVGLPVLSDAWAMDQSWDVAKAMFPVAEVSASKG